jgi:hypothetical protein
MVQTRYTCLARRVHRMVRYEYITFISEYEYKIDQVGPRRVERKIWLGKIHSASAILVGESRYLN